MIGHIYLLEIILKDQRGRCWSLSEKTPLMQRISDPEMTMSFVARQEAVTASFFSSGANFEPYEALTAVSAAEAVVPSSKLAAARGEISKLQRVLGKKTLEKEILKEAVEYAAEKVVCALALVSYPAGNPVLMLHRPPSKIASTKQPCTRCSKILNPLVIRCRARAAPISHSSRPS